VGYRRAPGAHPQLTGRCLTRRCTCRARRGCDACALAQPTTRPARTQVNADPLGSTPDACRPSAPTQPTPALPVRANLLSFGFLAAEHIAVSINRQGVPVSPVVSDRAQTISAAIRTKGAESEFGQAPIIIGGDKRMLPVYKVSTRLLAYNLRNGRFKAELLAKERELNRELNPLLAPDAELIRGLLLDQDADQTRLLKDDLRKYGQNEPGIITHDGYVINGNRRMAILRALHEEEPTGKFEHLHVQILPERVDKKDLWRIEAGLQLSRDKRLDYGPINDLLKIREGLDAGLSPDEIAAALFGVESADDIKEMDERLKLIDNYLEYAKRPQAYVRIQGQVEHFINLQSFLKRLKKASVGAAEVHRLLLVAFEMLRTGSFGHMDIRRLAEIHRTEDAKKHLLASVQPRPEEEMTDTRRAEIKEAFQTAQDYVAIENDATKPERLVDRAERAVSALVKHRKDVAKKKPLHRRVTTLKNQVAEVEKACAARQAKA